MHKLVFTGQILEGFSADAVRAQLLGLLKLPAEEAHRVFSGAPVTLKRNLNAADAQRYLKHLNSLGIGVRIDPPIGGASPFPTLIIDDTPDEPEPPAAPPAKAPEAAPPAQAVPAAPPPMTVIEEIVCPKCSERQPKRTLCRACATDMPRFLAAQQEAEAEIRAARLQATAPPASKSGAEVPADSIELADPPAWLGFSLDGRFGRLSYLWAGSAALLIAAAGMQIGLKTMNFGLLAFAFIVAGLLTLRYTALRCHDNGWNGWLALGILIPYLGSLFSLILLILPGEKRDNQFGPPPRPAGRNAAIIGILALIASTALFVSGMNQAMRIAGKYLGQAEVQAPTDRETADDGPLVPGSYSAANNVLIYHVDHSDPDSQRLESGLKLLGVTPRMVDMPTQGEELGAMLGRLQAAGYDISQLALPIVEANGTLIPNSPSLQEVARHLKKN